MKSYLPAVLAALSVYHQNDNPCEQAIVAIANRYTKHTMHCFALEAEVPSRFSIATLNTLIILNSTSASQQWQDDIYIVMSRDVSLVTNFLRNATFTFRKDTPWVHGFNGNIEITELKKLFEICFYSGISNVVAVTRSGSNAKVYTYNPFRIGTVGNRCYNYNPVLIDVWISRKFVYGSKLFYGTNVDNAQNCFVNVSIYPSPPYVLYNANDSVFPLNGSALKLFEALRMKMNFTPAFSLLTNFTRGFKTLAESPAAIGFGISLFAGTPNIAQGTVLAHKGVSWCVPTIVSSVRGWKALTNTFSWNLWLSFIVSVVLAVVESKIFLRYSDQKSRIRTHPPWLIVWKIVLEAPLPTPEETKLRIIFLSYCVLCLVIGTLYKAKLHGLMTSAPRIKKMTTLSQVYDTELDLWVTGTLLQTLQNEPSLKKRVRFYEATWKNASKYALNCLNERSGAVVLTVDSCRLTSKNMGITADGYYKAYPIHECLLTVGGIGFVVSSKSPFMDRVGRISTSMWESGMGPKYLSTPLPHNVLTSGNVVISLQDMTAVFWVLLGGLAVSVCVFVGEIICRRKKTAILLTKKREAALTMTALVRSGESGTICNKRTDTTVFLR